MQSNKVMSGLCRSGHGYSCLPTVMLNNFAHRIWTHVKYHYTSIQCNVLGRKMNMVATRYLSHSKIKFGNR